MKAFLPDKIRISRVHLRTANLERALEFYTGVLGLKTLYQAGPEAVLSAAEGPGLLALTEDRNATLRPPKSIGLYHFALRYPERRGLAQAFQRLLRNDYPVTGASDHTVSEAIYLSDPDSHGVELYADRPRAQWRWHNGHIAMSTKTLDLENLLAVAGLETGAHESPPRVDIGHIHLHVADLAEAERFYSGFLGLDVTQRSYPGALFLAAGGYHHHIGVNTWAGKSAPPANSAGLISYRLEIPVAEILYCLGHRAPLLGYETRTAPNGEGHQILQVRDPNGAWLEVQASPNAAGAT